MIPLKHLERFYPLAKGKFFYVPREASTPANPTSFAILFIAANNR